MRTGRCWKGKRTSGVVVHVVEYKSQSSVGCSILIKSGVMLNLLPSM